MEKAFLRMDNPEVYEPFVNQEGSSTFVDQRVLPDTHNPESEYSASEYATTQQTGFILPKIFDGRTDANM